MSQFIGVKKHILEMHREPEFHGVNFSLLLGWFSHKTISPFFHFFANVLANLSATQETREAMPNPRYRLVENVILSILSLEQNRRKGVLKTLRNCFFEWENPKVLEYFLDPKHKVLENLLKCLAFNLYNLSLAQGNQDISKMRGICSNLGIILTQEDESKIPSQAASIEDIDLVIDILVVLTNVDPKSYEVKFDLELARELLTCTRKMISQEDLLNKLDVISVLFLKENPMG